MSRDPLKIHFGIVFDVVPVDVDVMVALVGHVLVEEAEAMKQLVDDAAFRAQPAVDYHLLWTATSHADFWAARPTVLN